MKKWILTSKKGEEDFTEFEEAAKALKRMIVKEINRTPVFYDGLPFSVGSYFGYKYENQISDEEIVIDERLRLLLRTLNCRDPKNTKKEANRSIFQNYSYSEKSDLGEEMHIEIVRKENITLDIQFNDGVDDMYLSTNVFDMDDESRTYYFNFRQIVVVSSSLARDELGKVYSDNMTLKEVHF